MAGVTSAGFEVKTTEDILTEIEQDETTELGPGLDFDPDQPLGQLNGIMAAKLNELWEVAQVAYNAFNPNQAEGNLLDTIGALRGVTRLAAEYSYVEVSLNVNAGTSIGPSLRIANPLNPTQTWQTDTSVTIPVAGTYPFLFRSSEKGAFFAAPGSLTQIVTPVSGLNSVTNNLAASPGRFQETDAEYRLRQQQSLGGIGSCTVDAIRAQLTQIEGVRSVSILENVNHLPDANGVPGHAFESVLHVTGAQDPVQIADTIWQNKPAGIATHGTTTESVVDAFGGSHLVKFSYATPYPIGISYEIQVLPGWNPSQEQDIDLKVSEYFASLGAGEDVAASQVYKILQETPNVWCVVYCVVDGDYYAAVPPRSYASYDGANAAIVPIPGVP